MQIQQNPLLVSLWHESKELNKNQLRIYSFSTSEDIEAQVEKSEILKYVKNLQKMMERWQKTVNHS